MVGSCSAMLFVAFEKVSSVSSFNTLLETCHRKDLNLSKYIDWDLSTVTIKHLSCHLNFHEIAVVSSGVSIGSTNAF